MQITLTPELRVGETVNRIIDSKHITSVECIGKQIEITMDNGTIFIENHSSHEEAEHRYDDFCILWAVGDTTLEQLEPTRAHAHGSLNWIKLEAPSNTYFFKADDVRYIKTFSSGVRMEINDGRSTDVIMDPDKAEEAIMDMATEDWL